MQRQLVLLDLDRREWKLDERTRQVGRTGVARAREALRGSAGGHGSRRGALTGAEAGDGGCAPGTEAIRRAARPPAA